MLPSSEMHADKTQNGPLSPLTSPPETTAFQSLLSRIQSQHLKIMISTHLLDVKLNVFFSFLFQLSAERYLFDKITESTYCLVLNVSFGRSLLTKSCICFMISQPHTMSSLSTPKPSYQYFLNVGTSALLQSSKTLLNINIIKPNNYCSYHSV